MTKLLSAVCLLAMGAPAAYAGEASSIEQISRRSAAGPMSQIDRSAVAQGSAPEFAGRAEVRGIGAPVLAANTVDRQQEGVGHSELIEQSGEGNAARLRQSGQGHVARLLQTGQSHQAEISQSGQGHFASLSQVGQSNTAGVFQTGGFGSALISQAGSFNTVSIRQ